MIINYPFNSATWQSTYWAFSGNEQVATLSGVNDILSNIKAYIRPGEQYTVRYTIDAGDVNPLNNIQIRLNGTVGILRYIQSTPVEYSEVITAGNSGGGLEVLGNANSTIAISGFTLFNHFNIKNDKYLVSSDSTITNFKNTHNQFIRDLRDSSLLNILSNPTMHHRIGGNDIPWQWDIDVTGNQEHTNGAEHYIRFGIEDGYTDVYFYNAVSGGVLPEAEFQEVSQEVTSKLLAGKDYLAIFEFDATDAVTVEIQSLSINPPDPAFPTLIDLTDGTKKNLFTQSFSKQDIQDNNGRVQQYFYFRCGEINGTEDFGWVRFVIKSNAPSYKLVDGGSGLPLPDNTLNIKRLSLVKGGIEFFEGINRDPFLENVRYNHDEQYWEITNGEVFDTYTEPDGSLTVVYKWHRIGQSDLKFNQELLDVKDKTYNILYKLESVDGVPVLGFPYIHYPVPDIGQWNELQSYVIGDIVIHNNLKWRCILGNLAEPCLNKDPSTFPEFWENILWYTDYIVKDNFLDAQKAYYKEHIQVLDGNGTALIAPSGTHVFTDRATGDFYTFDTASETPTLITTALNPANNNTDATYLGDAYDTTHRHDGDHSILINGTSRVMSLSINATTGELTPQWDSKPKFIPADSFTNDDLYRFYEIFTNSDPIDPTVSMWHDAQGRHLVKDDEGNWWTLYVENGQMKFEWATSDITELRRKFQLFRQEHDAFGRHILRGINSGVYVTPSTNGVNTVYINPIVMNPVEDINQFLTYYNKSHDIEGRHYFTEFEYGNYFVPPTDMVAGQLYPCIDINTGTATNMPPIRLNAVTYYPEVHPDRIKFDGSGFHQDVQGFVHTFYVAGNQLIGYNLYFGNAYPLQIIQSKTIPFPRYYVKGTYIQETNTSDAPASWFIMDYNPANTDINTGLTKCYEIIVEEETFNAVLTPTVKLEEVAYDAGYPTTIQLTTNVAWLVEDGKLTLGTII